MSPVPALPSDLLSALSERRTTPPPPLLKAQEHARGAEFGRTLRKKQASEAEERLSQPSQAEDHSSGSDEPEKVEDKAESTPGEPRPADGDRPDSEAKVAGEDAGRAQDAPQADGRGAEGPTAEAANGAKPDAAVAERAPEQPVTIRLLNQQLLHGGLQIRLDPREMLGKPTSPGVAPKDFSGMAKGEGERRTASGREQVEDDREGVRDGAAGRERASIEAPREGVGSAPRDAGKEPAPSERKSGRESPAANQAGVSGAAVDKAPTITLRPDRGAELVPRPLMDNTVRTPTTKMGAGMDVTRPVVAVAGARTGSSGREAGAGGAGAKPQAGVGADGRVADPAGSSEVNSAFRQQLARGLSAAVAQARGGKGASELVLHLQPASLGQVKVRVAFDQAKGGVSARFEVSSRETRRIVDGSLKQLRASLESRGVGVGDLEVRLAPRERPVSDPLGLVSGTPYAEGKSDVGPFMHPPVNPDGGRGGQADVGVGGGGSGGEQMFQSSYDGQSGQDARTDRGQGSTDAPRSSSTLSDASAERLAATNLPDGALMTSRDEGGALRLVIDAIA
jgi:hypothetical protein